LAPKFEIQVDDELLLFLQEARFAREIFQLIDSGRKYLEPWLPWVNSVKKPADTVSFLKQCYNNWQEGNPFSVVIVYSGKAAGIIGFSVIDSKNKRCTIGYWLGRQYQGYGIMTRACKVMVDYALYELGMNRTEIRCATRNFRSRAIPVRLGFTMEGIAREMQALETGYTDVVIYSILKKKWPGVSI